MSSKRKRTIRICRRAAYLMFRHSARSQELLNAREFVTRCYWIS